MKGIVWNFEMFYLLTWLAIFLDYLVQVVTSRGHSTSTIQNPFHHLHSHTSLGLFLPPYFLTMLFFTSSMCCLLK